MPDYSAPSSAAWRWDPRDVIENRIFKDVRWVSRKDLPHYYFLEADAGLVEELARGGIL